MHNMMTAHMSVAQIVAAQVILAQINMAHIRVTKIVVAHMGIMILADISAPQASAAAQLNLRWNIGQ